MLEGRSIPQSKIYATIGEYALQMVVILFQVLALSVMVLSLLQAWSWMSKPFPGVLVYPSMVVSPVGTAGLEPWSADGSELTYPQRVLAVNELPATNGQELAAALAVFAVGEEVQITAAAAGETPRQIAVRLQAFPIIDQLLYFWTPFFLAFIFLGSGIWLFGMRRRDRAAHSFALMSATMAIVLSGAFDMLSTHALLPVWLFGLAFAGGSFISLGVLFPQEVWLIQRHAWLRWLGYAAGGVLALLGLFGLLNPMLVPLGIGIWHLLLLFCGVAAFFYVLLMLFRWRSSASPIVRGQARLILAGSALAFGPIGLVLLLAALPLYLPAVVFTPYLYLPLGLFPLVTAYAIQRYRVPDVDYITSRAAAYMLLTMLTVGGYALLVTGASLLFGRLIQADHPFFVGGLVFALALLLNPVRARLQRLVDRFFYRSPQPYQNYLQAFSRTLGETSSLMEILTQLRQVLDEALSPAILHIYTFEPLLGQYGAAEDSTGKPSSELRFPGDSPLVAMLASRGRMPLYLRSGETLPQALFGDRARLALLEAEVYIPLPGRKRLVGWIALGQRKSGDPYTREALNFLEALGDQAALAVERAQVVSDLERRVEEMDVLARIAQGINITLNFDDILELVFAQTSRLIPTRDFAITLRDRDTDTNYHAFFIEDDERVNKKENRLIPEGLGLEPIVLRSGSPLVAVDYERECRGHGMLPAVEGLLTWVGVPLTSGAETIGVLSLGTRSPDVNYSAEQVRLLQAIGDHVAGAIVKASLLEESQKRAREMASLNDVARVLGSTLDIDELLDRILRSAVEILECEAGTLFLVDEETDELIFSVTVGPVAEDLVGQRLPPGTGLVGRAVSTRGPVVSNDVMRNKSWFAQPDEKTGFHTRSLLVFPMIVKDEVIGVIEVINKTSGMPFSVADQELLQAFAAQAAVAYENARLYTMTDQALAERVEELSVMQRIDRELNASLDVARAMRITLEWAMRQSRVEAGLIAVLEENTGARVMAYQGYPSDHNFLAGYLPEHLPAVERAIESGQLQRSSLVEAGSHGILLEGGQSQIVAPIRRETQVIGLVLLESRQSSLGDEEFQMFLARLSDHAAIAISNAQLYAAVQQANQAKSDFISMVSHELKTPMTSIRGYADLLSAGAVGPINEAQANFLNTIRSNVERMQILVSDLADVARIEAGRLRLDYRAESINAVINEVVNSAQNQVNAKQQQLVLEVREDLPKVWGDRGRLIQVLTNLVSNANKYSPEKATITIWARHVPNEWDPDGAPFVVHLSVSDTGYGISEQDQRKIFQKFFRAEDQEVRNVPGTGLGLNITRHLVEIQGGRIWFESQYRKGTTFHFTVPVAEEV